MSESKIISGNREISLTLVNENASRAATGFTQRGIKGGDTIALLLRNDFVFFEASFTSNILGTYVVPINWHASVSDVAYILQDCNAKVIVIHADLFHKYKTAILADIEIIIVETPPEICDAFTINDLESKVPQGHKSWDTWITEFEPSDKPPPVSHGSMIYTSGTTGQPKGVRREPMAAEQLLVAMKMACSMYGFRPDIPEQKITTVMTGPMYHTAPNGYALLAARLGATIILQPKFNELELLVSIEKYSVTHIHMVPAMFVRLLNIFEKHHIDVDLSSLLWIAHGAAPCPPVVKKKMIDWWGPVINEYYASTETGGVTVQSSEGARNKPGSVGVAIDGIDIQILDDKGQSLPFYEAGNIYIRTKALGDFTYHGKELARTEIARGDYVWIGDIGYLDPDGYLYLCDRRIDIINSGGVNIYTAEIESSIMELNGVTDCAVFGIPDDGLGEVVCAYIINEDVEQITKGKVINHIKEQLGSLKSPKTVVFTEELPRQESGKILKKQLRDLYWQGEPQAI